jgi:hypothetical protein
LSTIKISIAELDGAIAEYVRTWDKEINEAIDREAEKSAKKLVEETKKTAPVGKRKKHYRDSISLKRYNTSRTTKYIWYVKGPDYRLSHLLENGHALKNGGRSKAFHFIRDASEPIIKDYETKIEEVIKNG